MCNTYLQQISCDQENDADAKQTKAKKLREDPLFQAVMKELEVQRLVGFSVHPKMDRLKTIVIDHFGQKLGDHDQDTEETKVMVFVTFREAVDEIVDMFNRERPLIRAH